MEAQETYTSTPGKTSDLRRITTRMRQPPKAPVGSAEPIYPEAVPDHRSDGRQYLAKQAEIAKFSQSSFSFPRR